MVINITKNSNCVTIAPVGRLDSTSAGEFESFLQQNFTSDIEKLILDFINVDFISSKGLRVLVSIYKKLNGRSIEIVNLNASVREVFRLSGLLRIFGLE